MVKHTASANSARIAEKPLIEKITKSDDPIGVLQGLMKEQHILIDLYDRGYIKSVKETINNSLLANVKELEQNVRKGVEIQSIEKQLLRVLKIKFVLMKNSRFQMEPIDDQVTIKILIWSHSFQLIECVFKQMADYLFLKETKIIYYFIKFFTEHLNAYSSTNHQLLDILNPPLQFKFQFQKEGIANINQAYKEINVKDIISYSKTYKNTFFTVLKMNEQFNLQLKEDQMMFLSIMTKIKICINEDRESVLRCVMYGVEILTHIYVVLVEIQSQVKIPTIFLFPPNYINVLKNMWQLIFNKNVKCCTQLASLAGIHRMLKIEEMNMKNLMKRRVLDDMVKDSVLLINRMLQQTYTFIQTHSITQSNTFVESSNQSNQNYTINIQLLSNPQFLKTILKMMGERITDCRQIFAAAESIPTYILNSKQHYQLDVIEYAGKIVLGFDAKQEQLMNIIIERVNCSPKRSLPYFKMVNFLLSSKYHRQRRDLGLVVRMLTESTLFTSIIPPIEQELKSPTKTLLMEVIRTISNLCSENPVAVDQIENNSRIISKLLSIIKQPQNVSNKQDDISTMILFIHHVSLKQGNVRNIAFGQPLIQFYTNILSSSSLLNLFNQKGSSNILNNINKLLTNLPQSERSLSRAIRNVLFNILQKYRQAQEEGKNLMYKPYQSQIQFLQKLYETDTKLSNVLKTIQKIKHLMIQLCGKQLLIKFIRCLETILLHFDYPFADMNQEDKFMMHIIDDCKKAVGVKQLQQVKERLRSQPLQVIELDSNEQVVENNVIQEEKKESKQENMVNEQEQRQQRQMEQKFKLLSDDEFEKKTNEIIDQCIEQIKKIKLPLGITNFRRLHDIVISKDCHEGNENELTLIKVINKFQRYIIYLIKSDTVNAVMNINLDRVFNMFPSILICLQVLPSMNKVLIAETLPQLQKIGEETIIHYNHSSTVFIKNRQLNKQMFLKVIENLTSTHTLIDTYSKLIVKIIHTNPTSMTLHEKLSSVVLTPLLNLSKIFISQLQTQLSKIDSVSIQYMRCLAKMFSQIFCVNEPSARRPPFNSNILSPINIVICYHYYFLPEGGYSIINFMSDLSYKILALLENAKDEYQDIPQNRPQCLKVAILRVIGKRTQNLLSWVYGEIKLTLKEFDNQQTQERKMEGMYRAHYVHQSIQEHLMQAVKNTNFDFKKNSQVRNEFASDIIRHIYQPQYHNNIYKERTTWWFLIDLPPRPNMNLISQACFEQGTLRQTIDIYQWLSANINRKIPGLRNLFRTLLSRLSRQFDGDLLHPQKQKIWNIHNQLSQNIGVLCKTLFPSLKLHLGIKLPKIKAVDYLNVDIPSSIRKLSNLVIMIGELVIFYDINKLYSKGNFIVRDYYIQSLLEFGQSILDNFEDIVHNKENIFQQSNDLIYNLVVLTQDYLVYKKNLTEDHQLKKKENQKAMKKIKRKMFKTLKMKKKNKHNTKDDNLDKNQEEKSSQSPYKILKTNLEFPELKANKQNSLRKVKSMKNLHEEGSLKRTPKKGRVRTNKKISQLSYQFTTFLKTTFQCSQKYAFIGNNTLQALLKLLIFSLPQKNQTIRKMGKKIFEVNPEQLIKPLLKIQIKDKNNKGLFYLLSELSVRIVSHQYSKIDSQMTIKRFMFEHLPSKQVKLKQFKQFLQNQLDQNISNLGYLVEILNKTDNNKIQITQGTIEEYKNNQNCVIKLKDNVELYQINTVTDKKRKASHNFTEDQKPKKTIDFIPQGNTLILINQIMQAIIRLFIKQIILIKTDLKEQQLNKTPFDYCIIDAFNIRVLTELIQILTRLSPWLIPYIVKFKCKKIVQQELSTQKCPIQKVQLINDLIFDKNSNADFNFLSILSKLLCPFSLNHLNSLLIDLCLDGLVLYLNPKNNVVTFGSYLRQRVVWQLSKNISQDDSIIKKLTSINTLTNLLIIRDFSEICLEKQGNILQVLHDEYIKVSGKNLPYTHLILPFFLKPIQILHELSISLSVDKKHNPIIIGKWLTTTSIKAQFISSKCFKHNKFQTTWPYNVFGQLQIQFDDEQIDQQGDDADSDSDDSDADDEDDDDIHQMNSENESMGVNQEPPQQQQSASRRDHEWQRNWDIEEQLEDNNHSNQIQIRLQYPLQPQENNEDLDQIDDDIDDINEDIEENDDDLQQQQDEEEMEEEEDQNDEDDEGQDSELVYEDGSSIMQIFNLNKNNGKEQQIDLYALFDSFLQISDKIVSSSEVTKLCTNQFRSIRAVFKLSDTKPQSDQLLHQQYHQLLQIFHKDTLFSLFKYFSLHHFVKLQNFATTKPQSDPFHPSNSQSNNDPETIEIQRRNRRTGRIYEPLDFLPRQQQLQRLINRRINPQLRNSPEPENNQQQHSNSWLRLQENGNIGFVNFDGLAGQEFHQMGEGMDNIPHFIQEIILQDMDGNGNGQIVQEQNHPPINLQGNLNGEVIEPYEEHQQVHQQQRNIQAPPSIVQQSYRKVSMDHTKKLLKDPIQLLNKNGKNNNKFIKCSDIFLQSLLGLLFQLNLNQHTNFPYKLIECLFINSQNSAKILSTILFILKSGPNLTQINQNTIRNTVIPGFSGEIIDNYQEKGFKIICLKILHLISMLSKQFTIAMMMLDINQQSTNEQNKMQKRENFFEVIVNLLSYQPIRSDPEILKFLVDSLNNISSHHFGKTVTSYFQKQKLQNNQNLEKQPSNENMIEFQSDAKIEISDQAMKDLCQALQKNYFKKENNAKVSMIIMRLCANISNLNGFIKFFNKAIRDVAKAETVILKKIQNHQIVSHYTPFSLESKIVNLLTIVSEVLKSIRERKAKQETIYQQFAGIISCKQLKEMCELGIDLMNVEGTNTLVFSKISEILDCYFIIFKMAMNKNNPVYDKNEKGNISKLGEFPINQINRNESNKDVNIVIGDFELSQIWNKKICNQVGKNFINIIIRKKLRGNFKNNKSVFDIPIVSVACQTPHIIQFDNKKALFRSQIKRIHRQHSYNTLQLVINREDVFNQSFTQIMSRKPEQLFGRLKIQFQDEEGEDVGGLTRQWFQILSRQIFNANYALFKPSSSGTTFQPSSMSYINSEHLHYFKFIGRIMGKALHDGFMLDAYFTPAFYRHLLALPITYLDMEQEDYEYYKSLKWILDNSPIEDYMDLTFTYEFDNFGERKAKQLMPGGKDIKVVESNKIQYVQLISYAKMALSVKNQIQALLQGFHDLIPHQLVKIFDSKEIELLISGLPTIDIADLKLNTQLHNYNKNDQIIIWFFQVLEEFNMDLRTSFLQFVTGTSRVPSEGFKGLRGLEGEQKFNIHRYYDVLGLPRAHTCFNQLDLPPYPTKEILIEKLTLAITQGKQGFGIV